VYVELAPSNGTSYVDAVVPIIHGIAEEHGFDASRVVLCPNRAAGPVTAFHGQAIGEQLRRLPDLLNGRMGGVGNQQFEYGLKRALELVGPDTELVLISANLALADMTDADRASIKRISASRVVDAISFADPPGNPGDRPGDPPIDFVPLVSGRVVTVTYGAIPRRVRDDAGRPKGQ
jgi:hypothetical protein